MFQGSFIEMLTSLKGNHFETYFGPPYRYDILDGSDELLTTRPYEWQIATTQH